MAVPDRESRSALGVSILMGFALAFAAAFLEYRQAHIISRFVLGWEFSRAASIFAGWMPPLLFAACAASMSLHREQGLRFAELIRPVLVPALVLALLFSVLELTVLPSLRRTQNDYETLSRLFYDSLKEAEDALGAEDIPRAQERIALCGAIDNSEERYKELNERIQRAFLKTSQDSVSQQSSQPAPLASSDTGASAYELFKRAQRYYQQGDFYSAHWYAGKALILDPGRRDARILQSEAWEKITSSAENPTDKARAAFFARKVNGYTLLQSGDYLGAYRVFTDLVKESPDDPDVSRYWKESRDRLSKTAFFGDEYRRAFAGGGVRDFAARIFEDGVDYVIYASNISSAGSFLYLEGFEYLKTDATGPLLHVWAPYARITGTPAQVEAERGEAGETGPSWVSLRRVERNSPREASAPTYLVGRPSPPGDSVLDIPMGFEDLSALLELKDDAARIPFFRLISGIKIAERYGWDPDIYRREIAFRISIPIILVILVLLGTAVGARFRREEEPGRIRMMATLPLLTVLVSVPLSVAVRSGQQVLARLYALLPASGAMAVWVGFLAVLLALSLLAVGRLGVHASD